MPERRARYAATNKNLLAHGLAPLMRWLIPTALDEAVLTYGEVKGLLETEGDFSTVFATRVGFLAGALMHRLQDADPSAPLINVLVVNQRDRKPSKGAGSFMAERFDILKLAEKKAKQRYPKLWAKTFERAAGEVSRYSEAQWQSLYQKAFGEPFTITEIETRREKRKKGSERDGLPYGRNGEGPNHRALRLWVRDNPHRIHASFAKARSATEVELDSKDRVDAVFYCKDRTVVVEVKSRDSNENDLYRGVYQCIKYRAVKEAMAVGENKLVEAYLITEEDLPKKIGDLLALHKISHFKAPKNRRTAA